MASTKLKNTFATTYRDDFTDSDNYHRILFNSGRALQARELTQMQTIIQREIERFGSNVFNDNAPVLPGGITVNKNYEFIKLNTTASPLPTDYATTVVGTTFTGNTSNYKFKVIEVVEATGSDPATLYVQLLGGDSGASTVTRATPGETITNGSKTLTVQTINTVANPAVGKGHRTSVAEGVYFALGHFVYNEAQSIITSKYTTTYNGDIVFKVAEDIVTVSDDTALYDNTGSTPNLTSPGADRYRITLTLTRKEDLAASDSYITIAEMVDGEVDKQPSGFDQYNQITKLLAQRTSEESGNYTVNPYTLKFDDSGDNLIFDVSNGVSYVNGFRTATSRVKIPVSKPTTLKTLNGEVVGVNYGNYVDVSSIRGLPNVNEFEEWNLNDDSSYLGSNIGTARVKHVERTGSTYKYYLMDINMTGSNDFRNVKSIGVTGGSVDSAYFANIALENNKAVLKDTINNNLLFPLPKYRPKSMTSVNYTYQKRFTTTTDGSDSAQLGPLKIDASTETYADTNLWTIVQDSGGEDVSTAAIITGSGTTVANITNTGVTSADIEILGYVSRNANVRTKTLTTTTKTGTLTTGSDGKKFLDLDRADIYDVLAVRKDNASGADYSGLFKLDNGQRDNFYTEGRLLLDSNYSTPPGNIYCQFRYFNHNNDGDFFSVSSYDGQVDYADIPSYRQADGEVVQLRDVLDFRSVKDVTGSNFTGTDAKVHELPRPTDTINLNVEYYLPRNDKVIVTEGNTVEVLNGTPSFDPKFRDTPENAMDLFLVELNPNTLDENDLRSTRIDNRRFTMRDIAALQKRVENLEETTALSLLELDTKNFNVVDSNGALRTKAGFLVDNFKDLTFTDPTVLAEDKWRAAIDFDKGSLFPKQSLDAIRLILDSGDANSTNIVRENGYVMLSYDSTPLITQDVASRSTNINPFAVSRNAGRMELSPTTDAWVEVNYAPKIIQDGGTRTTYGSTSKTYTLEELVSDTLLNDQGIVPFMRSRKVYFKAQGLKQNQQHYAFFDTRSVADWVREETFKNITDDSNGYGNTLINSTAHPEGSSTLVSDANGIIEGSFVVPSTDTLKFRTGTREFALLNISSYNPSDATSVAQFQYTGSGVLEERQQTFKSTRIVQQRNDNNDGGRDDRGRSYDVPGTVKDGNGNDVTTSDGKSVTGGGTDFGCCDPLAQTFLVSADNGVFATSVQIYFETLSSDEPVFCEIRPTVNGVPSSFEVIPGATTVLYPGDTDLKAVPSATISSMRENASRFTFDAPVYLAPGEYAIVLLTNSLDYNVYISQTDEYLLGSTEGRVARQPSLGSLFRSQNARTWEPSQHQDLAFILNRADFVSSGSALLQNAKNPQILLPTNPFIFDSGSTTIRVSHENHGFRSGDTVHFYGLDSSTTYGGILGDTLLDSDHPIVDFDYTGYTFTVDSSATSTTIAGGNSVLVNNNVQFDRYYIELPTLLPRLSFITPSAKFTTGQSFAGSETRFQKDTSFNTGIQLGVLQTRNAPSLIAQNSQEISELSGDRSFDLKIEMQTEDTRVSPVIDLERAQLLTANFIIDKQVDSDEYQALLLTDVGPSGENVPLSYVPETSYEYGSSAAKHLTTPVVLDEAASGLKIIMGASRPSVAEIEMYYRTADENQVLADQPFVLIQPEQSVPSNEDPNLFRDYSYLAGGINGALTSFTKFQIKIVFRSTNSSKVPVVRDIRAIALVD